MSRFLDFLNTADLNTLTQVPGINRQLAGNLIAARPFDATEDCLEVKGMGKTLLKKLELFAEAQENASGNSAMVPVTEEAVPVAMDRIPSAQDEAQEQDSFLRRLGRAFHSFMLALLRLIMLAILFIAVGAMFYYGLPYIQNTFIAPVERNTAQIEVNSSQIEELSKKIEDLQLQINQLTVQVNSIEKSIDAQTASIQKLEDMQATLETEIQQNHDEVLIELTHEVMFTRALDILARARLYLAQSNFGLAKTDIQTARDLLVELEDEKNDEVLTKAIERLDLALGNLPDFPVVASGDLEIAWQILISGNGSTNTTTLTPQPIGISTPTPAEVSSTATPTAVPQYTPTP